jgi:uncharacterized membrane protein
MADEYKNAGDHALERLVFFSDAVFAIAITLLILEVHAPELPKGVSDMAHWHALRELIPSLFGFALSFYVIARFWISHHKVFSLAERYDEALLVPNLWLLAAIAFLPFVTAYLGTNIGQRVPTLIYNASFLITAVLSLRLIYLVTSSPILKAETKLDDIHILRARGWAVILAVAIALVASLAVPEYGQLALVAIGGVQRLLAQRWRKGAKA